MNSRLVKLWNQSHKKIPRDKISSVFARDNEKLFPRSCVVCDLGGGTGSDALYFLEKGHVVWVVDISKLALKIVVEKSNELKLKQNLTTVQVSFSENFSELPSEKFDVVYSHLALHYFSREQTLKILMQIRRILKKDGNCFISIKGAEDLKEMDWLKNNSVETEEGVFNDHGKIKSRFTIKQWTDMIKDVGISNYTVKTYIEDFSGRNDIIQSGSQIQTLTEIFFTN